MTNVDREFISYVETGNLNGVTGMLESGASAYINNDYALKWSAQAGNLDIFLKLLEYSEDFHSCKNYASRHRSNRGHLNVQDYALGYSSSRGYLNIVIKLLELGANVNMDEVRGLYSALENSVAYNHLNIVIKLLEYNADVHVHNDNALRISAQYCHIKIMEQLLEHGANIYCNNGQILKQLQTNFNEEIADAMLPYCSPDDYEHFPLDYIKKRVIPTKNASTQ